MVNKRIDPRAQSIEIRANTKREFFLVHGYSGGSKTLEELARFLNKEFNATVRIIRLKGHGQTIEELNKYDYYDFLNQIEREIKKDIKKKEIIIGGLSMGGCFALDIAARYPVKGVFIISPVYKTNLLFTLLTLLEPLIIKKNWKKPMRGVQEILDVGGFAYPQIPIKGLKIVKQAEKRLNFLLPKISCPCLLLSPLKEPIVHEKSTDVLIKSIGSKRKRVIKYKNKNGHALILSEYKKDVFNKIRYFFKETFT